MNPQDQITALAELDGWTEIRLEFPNHPTGRRFIGTMPDGTFGKLVPDYLYSRDAIVPVIEKVGNKNENTAWSRLCDELYRIAKLTRNIKTPVEMDVITLSPSQLSEALLRATRKWKELLK